MAMSILRYFFTITTKYVKIVNMSEKPMFIRRKIDAKIQEYLKLPEILAILGSW